MASAASVSSLPLCASQSSRGLVLRCCYDPVFPLGLNFAEYYCAIMLQWLGELRCRSAHPKLARSCPHDAVTIHFPSGLNSAEYDCVVMLQWAVSGLPLCASQTRAVLSVRSGHNPFSVGLNCAEITSALMLQWLGQRLAALRIPYSRGLVRRSGHDPFSVGAELVPNPLRHSCFNRERYKAKTTDSY